MHGRSFNVLKKDEIVTVWGNGSNRGRRGRVVATFGEGRNGHGEITVRFDDGTETIVKYPNVAFGDNSERH